MKVHEINKQKKKSALLLALVLFVGLGLLLATVSACGMLTQYFEEEQSPSSHLSDSEPEPTREQSNNKTGTDEQTLEQTTEQVEETLPEPPADTGEAIIISLLAETAFTVNGNSVSFLAYEIERQMFLDIFELSAALSASLLTPVDKLIYPRWNENRDTLYIESGIRFTPGDETDEAAEIDEADEADEAEGSVLSHVETGEIAETHFISQNYPLAVPKNVTVFLNENVINIPAFYISGEIYFSLYELAISLDLVKNTDLLENRIDIFTSQLAADILTRRSRIDPSLPMVAITFDDGPGKVTDEILDVLEKYNAVATFFVIGRQVNNNSETIKRAFDMGNEIANHTWSHSSLDSISADSIRKQLRDTNHAVESVTGIAPVLMRPPFGSFNATTRTVTKELGLPIIMWSIDPSDYLPRSTDTIYDFIMERLTDRDIILFHDTHGRAVKTTEKLITSLLLKGYQLVTVSELLYFSDITPEPGSTYKHTRG